VNGSMVNISEDAFARYIRVMERVGFYRNGKPTPGIIEAESLRANGKEQIDKRVKYSAVIDPGKLNAAAIFELSDSPCIYFSRLDQADPDSKTLAYLRKLAWNQGMAPILWIVTPTSVRIYNAYAKPTERDEVDPDQHLLGLFEQTERDLQRLHDFADRLQIETGIFWQKDKVKDIDRRHRVDNTLLTNLKESEDRLVSEDLSRSFAQSLLGRSIFVSYLQARNILTEQFLEGQFYAKTFVDILSDKSVTYELFRWIQKTFNGNLFPLEQQQESGQFVYEQDIVNERHLETVHSLLAGTELRTGQGRLWSPYDFSVIPVELISSIYEMFVHAENSQIAKERSTYYTPINLVDLVLSEVFKRLPPDAKILDASCGSGVFLVESLRRLVARRIANGEQWTRDMVRETLYDQIYGVDISKGAVQIAAFSLYLTTLELDPNPQLSEDLKFRPLVDHNLFTADAFDEEAAFNKHLPFSTKGFHAIVGNPPWRRNKANQLATDYCIRHQYPITRKSLDQPFFWRIGDFAHDETVIGLILHSRPLFSHTQQSLRARKELFTRFSPQVLVNLSDLRQDGLFPRATAPATVLIAQGCPSKKEDSFYFVRAEHTQAFKQHGIIEIGPQDIQRLPVSGLLTDRDMLKIASWGEARDMALIEHLRHTFPPLEKLLKDNKDNGWAPGQGFQKGGTDNVPELYGKKWLPSGVMPRYFLDLETLDELPEQKFHRSRDLRIYRGPLIITTRGLGKEAFYAAFCSGDVVYTEEYFGIAIPTEQEYFAHYLNGIFNSSLATYFLFMTASVWGVERDKVEPNDLKRLPVPLLTEANKQMIDRIVEIEGNLRQQAHDNEVTQLNEAVFALYGLDETEQTIIRDAVAVTIDWRMSREGSDALNPVSFSEVGVYATQLIDIIQPFLQVRGELAMIADIFDTGPSPLQVVKLSLVSVPGRRPPIQIIPEKALGDVLARIANLLPQKIADKIYTRRILRIYAGDDIYVIKPTQRRYWTRSAGLNDVNAILADQLRPSYASVR